MINEISCRCSGAFQAGEKLIQRSCSINSPMPECLSSCPDQCGPVDIWPDGRISVTVKEKKSETPLRVDPENDPGVQEAAVTRLRRPALPLPSYTLRKRMKDGSFAKATSIICSILGRAGVLTATAASRPYPGERQPPMHCRRRSA